MGKKVDIAEYYSKHDFARILRELADALESSQSFALYLQDRVISIPPDGEMKIEFQAEDGKSEVELELSWQAA